MSIIMIRTSEHRKVEIFENIVVKFVDPCLTSICQPPDVDMNALLKRSIRHEECLVTFDHENEDGDDPCSSCRNASCSPCESACKI